MLSFLSIKENITNLVILLFQAIYHINYAIYTKLIRNKDPKKKKKNRKNNYKTSNETRVFFVLPLYCEKNCTIHQLIPMMIRKKLFTIFILHLRISSLKKKKKLQSIFFRLSLPPKVFRSRDFFLIYEKKSWIFLHLNFCIKGTLKTLRDRSYVYYKTFSSSFLCTCILSRYEPSSHLAFESSSFNLFFVSRWFEHNLSATANRKGKGEFMRPKTLEDINFQSCSDDLVFFFCTWRLLKIKCYSNDSSLKE